jgi:exonuclease III
MLFSEQTKNRRRDPSNSTHTDLKILQWNAGGLSQNKKTELYPNLVKHDVDVFAIMEANFTAEKLIYFQLNGYTLHSPRKYRQIARGVLIRVSVSLCAQFKIVKAIGNSEDKSKIVKANIWKKGKKFTIYANYSPLNNKPDFTSLNITSKTIMIGDFNAHSRKWGYRYTNTAGKEMEDLLNTSTLELK